MSLSVLEICTGGGGQALGLELAGFDLAAAVEIDRDSCATLRLNRPNWKVVEGDVVNFNGQSYSGIDLFAGGVPCPPFSIAGKQLGQDDERDLFPEALRLIEESKPTAVLLENVRGFASNKFTSYRSQLFSKLRHLGYEPDFRVLNASSFGVPQLRPRFVLVALRPKHALRFVWPEQDSVPPTVGEAIGDLMVSRGWRGASAWKKKADKIGPTLVGGSKKHGGPDLGPSRARSQWAELGVDGRGIADEPPDCYFPSKGMPKITVHMAARIQGFPDFWKFAGKKTTSYRQVGNAFPPPVAFNVGQSILAAINGTTKRVLRRPKFSSLIPAYAQ